MTDAAGRPVRRTAEVLADLVPLDGRRVVDVGCGPGAMVRAICSTRIAAMFCSAMVPLAVLLIAPASVPLKYRLAPVRFWRSWSKYSRLPMICSNATG